MTAAAALIGIDWGSTHCRAYLLDADGQRIDAQHDTRGAMRLQPGQHAQVLDDLLQRWPDAKQLPVLMAGMVGARNGWHEVPYVQVGVQTPAALTDYATQLFPVPSRAQTWIVPGARARNRQGRIDVMRGEETQIFGAQILKPKVTCVCLPGTHSKWVRLVDQHIQQLDTFVTGELYALLRAHSFLAASLKNDSDDAAAFTRGLQESGDLPPLQAIFSVRVQILEATLKEADASAYLSGLLIGHELRTALQAKSAQVCVIASASLSPLYQRALAFFEQACTVVSGEDAVCAGLFALAHRAGILTE